MAVLTSHQQVDIPARRCRRWSWADERQRTAGPGALFAAVVRREIALAMRQKGDVLTPLFFFVIVASLFPLGVGPEVQLLARMAPGVLWVGALLAAMLSLQRLFAADHADGSLEQMAISSTPLTLIVWARCSRISCCPACRWC
jgi:ABC-type transport system involved in cytochrome c biogenesis permease component